MNVPAAATRAMSAPFGTPAAGPVIGGRPASLGEGRGVW